MVTLRLVLEAFRIANRYGLFAVMTSERYEIEFQGSRDGVNWTPYPFRYKPQDPMRAPGIYAPYQPREEKRATGAYWKREEIGLYAPKLHKGPERIEAVRPFP